MNTLIKKEGVYYTQNINDLPIEERVFFSEGKGKVLQTRIIEKQLNKK